MTLLAHAMGNLGKDAEYKRTQNGKEFCSFSVATTSGYGDNKVTTWVDVTRWGNGAEGLARLLTKGSKVTVAGELSTREHNGKTYLQIRADHVIFQGGRQEGSTRPTRGQEGYIEGFDPATGELDDDVPF